MKMGDHTIAVAISQPPERKQNPPGTAQSASIMSLGGGTKRFGL
jgi:hypothetical protein